MTEIIQKKLSESKSARWFVLVLVSFTMMCMYYLTDAMAPLQQNLQSNLHWSATDYGLFTSGYGWFNVFLLMLIVSGMILDKLGTRFTGILAIVIMLLGAGVKYWAITGHFEGMTDPIRIGSWQVLRSIPVSALMAGLGFGIFGVGCEMFGIAANKAVVRWFRGKEMALAIGLNTTTGRIGTALATGTPKWLYSITKDVSTPILLSMIFLLIGLLIYILFVFLDKKLDNEETETGVLKDEEFKFSDIKEIVNIKAFWYIAILCVLFYSAIFPFIKFATDFIIQKYSVDENYAGSVLSLLPIIALFLTPLFGGISDKKGKAASIMIFGSLILVFVHILFSISFLNSYIIAITLVLLLGIAFSLVPSAMWPSVAKIIPMSKLGTAYAMIFWVQNIGLMLVPLLIGSVLDKYCITGEITKLVDGKVQHITQYNYTIPMLIFACFGVLAIIFAYLLKHEDRLKGYGLEKPNIEK